MKNKDLKVELIHFITIILFYYITYNKNIFLYILTYSLYNIFSSCFTHISIKNSLNKCKNNYSKNKLLKYMIGYISFICLIFVLLSIFIGDMISIYLNIKNTFLPNFIMSLTIFTEVILKILLEYLESNNKYKLSNTLFYLYYILDSILLLTISILCFKIFKVPTYIGISLLYCSKIISFIIISIIIYKKIKIKNKNTYEEILDYKKEIKDICSYNYHKSLINLFKNCYFYISIIVLHVVLLSRYSYEIEIIENDLTYIYFYFLSFINLIKNILLYILNKDMNIIKKIYLVFRNSIFISIIIGITSPLICKILLSSSYNSNYLTWMCILLLFIILYDLLFDNIKNKKVIILSLVVGILLKIIVIVPLINSFYRMGYNLIYGDIISSIIGLSASIIINYIYIKINNYKEKTLEKILKILYDSIILCIILIILQFIVPINTDSYIKSIFILLLYIVISLFYLKFRYMERKR